MKKYREIRAKLLSFVLAIAMVLAVMPKTVFAAEQSTPTRTAMLNVSALTETTDMFTSEGWKWEPAADGGTLTLRNCYIQAQKSVLCLPFGDITIKLEGENTIERISSGFGPIIYAAGPDPNAALNVTIVAGTEDGKLSILRKDTSVTTNNPYGFGGDAVTIKSGDIYTNTGLCIIKSKFALMGGSLKVDAPNTTDSSGIYTLEGNVEISGGSLDINVGQVGIFILGNTNEGEQKVNLTGGNVKICGGLGHVGIYAKNITINSDGVVDLQGDRSALFCSQAGGTLEILVAGSLTLAGNKPYLPESSTGDKTVTIGGANYTKVNEALAKANALDPDHFITDLSGVTKAVNTVVRNKSVLEQNTVNGYAAAIEAAIATLVYKDADYTKVDEALAKIPSDLSAYTDASVKALNEAKNAVVRGKNKSEQATVDGYAVAIEAAIQALKYKEADYTKVDEALAKIPSDLSAYTDASIKALNEAKNAVVRGKIFTEQATVDGYAATIEDALRSLMKKTVITITNPESGAKIEYEDGSAYDDDVALSVTPKAQTEMNKFKDAVNKVAPGFTLGGLYGISLLKDGVAIQPDGKVKVSIPLTDKMKSMTNLQVVYIDDNGNVFIIPSEAKDGMITFITDHFGNYGVIGKVKATDPGNNTNNGNTNPPQTGDSTPVLLFVLMILASGTALVILTQKRRIFRHNKK